MKRAVNVVAPNGRENMAQVLVADKNALKIETQE